MSREMPQFVVDMEVVRACEALIQHVIRHSSHTTLNVPAHEFPAWLVALGKKDFHAQVTRGGVKFVRAGYTWFAGGEIDSTGAGGPILSVMCNEPPAPWVTFPAAEGDRRYMFHYTTNPLHTKESE